MAIGFDYRGQPYASLGGYFHVLPLTTSVFVIHCVPTERKSLHAATFALTARALESLPDYAPLCEQRSLRFLGMSPCQR